MQQIIVIYWKKYAYNIAYIITPHADGYYLMLEHKESILYYERGG